jgi:hypothetical protein
MPSVGKAVTSSFIFRIIVTVLSTPVLAQNSELPRKLRDFGATARHRRRHDHDSVYRHFHPCLPLSSSRLPGTPTHWPAASSERPATAAPRADSALLDGPTSLGLALPGLAAGPQRHGVGKAGIRGPVESQRLPDMDILALTIRPSGAAQDECRNP